MLGLIKIRTIQHADGLSKLLQNCLLLEISVDLKVLTLLLKDESVVGFFLNGIDKTNAEYFTLPNITWIKHQESNYTSNHTILVGNSSGDIKLHNVTFNDDVKKLNVEMLHSWSIHEICSPVNFLEQDDLREYEVLAFKSNQAVVCIGRHTIVTVIIKPGQPLYAKNLFQITDEGSKSTHVQLYNNNVFSLNQEGSTISAFSLDYGTKLWQYVLMENMNIEKFFISSSCDYVVLKDKNNIMYYSELILNNRRSATNKISKSVVTAFSKQTVATTAYQDGKCKAKETPIKDVEKGTVNSVLASENRIYICTDKDGKGSFQSFLYNGDLELKEKFPGHCFIVNVADSCCPPLIVSDYVLYTYSPESSTTDFVNKLMMYSSGHAVEYLSLLNQWEGISIDLDILELGLKNSQLDTVTFFLRVKSEEFRATWVNIYHGSVPVDSIEVKLDNWNRIFQTVKHFLDIKLKASSFVQFAEQILKVCIQVLIQLLKTVMSDFPVAPDKLGPLKPSQLPEVLFAKFLNEARQFLQNKINTSVDVSELEYQKTLLEHWKSLTTNEVILNSVESSCIPLALWFMRGNKEQSTLSNVQNLAREFVVTLLKKQKLDEAIKFLTKAGMKPTKEFLDVFYKTMENSLRNLLLPHLMNHKALNEDDTKAMDFIRLLEKVYPCTDFVQAREHERDNLVYEDIDYPIKSHLECAVEWDNSMVKEVLSINEPESSQDNLDGFSYARISIDIVKNLNDAEKEEVLVPCLFQSTLDSDIAPTPEAVWSYLLKRNLSSKLIEWIESFYTNESEFPKQGVFPIGWPISHNMINAVLGSTSIITVKENILNAFAKYGIICDDELEDIGLLLKRLGAASVVLAKPHPFSSPRASMTERDYYHRIIHYSLEHSLYNFLYYFLQDEGKYANCTFCPVCRVPILSAMIDFCRWSEEPTSENLRFQAILSSACLLNNIPEPSLEALCKNSTTNITLATMFFSPLKLSRVLENNYAKDEDRNLKQDLEKALNDFPMVHRVLCKGWPVQGNDNVSIYSLLQGNSFFDPSRLFGWQSTNTIASEEAPSEIPNFSSPHLVQKHSLNQNIDVSYYLVEGRPNYAYLKFVSQELLTWKTLSSQRLSIARSEASTLALTNYNTTKITSSCVGFIELLGLNSSALRTALQVALILHKDHFKKNEDDKEESVLVSLLTSLSHSMDAVTEVASFLDSVIIRKISLENKSRNYEYHLFLLLVQFCHLHQVDYHPTFLNVYAKRKDWFSLTILLQVLKIPRDHALEIVKKIPDKCLVDHLTTAFQSPTYGSKTLVTPQISLAKKVKPKCKESLDVRSFLYTKIGLRQTNVSPSQDTMVDTSDEDLLPSDEGSSSTNTTDSYNSMDDFIGQPKDLFEQLIFASKTTNPGLTLLHTSINFGNPIHALIAASLTDTEWLLCACTWIIAVLKLELNLPLEEILPGDFHVSGFNLNNLSELMLQLIERGHLKLLNRCALFFFPQSPILPLVDFIVQFFYSKKYSTSVDKLEEFKIKMCNFEPNNNHRSIGDLKWTSDIALNLVGATLILSKSRYEQKNFLFHLSTSNFSKMFSAGVETADYHALYLLLECLEDDIVEVPIINLLSTKDDPNFIKAAASVVGQLLDQQKYNKASQFGSLANLPKETVLVMQFNSEAELLDENFDKRKAFWEKCDQEFAQRKIDAETSVNFFKNWCEKALTYLERYYILVLIVKWSKIAGSVDLVDREMAMWLCCFQSKMQSLLEGDQTDENKLVIDSYASDSVDLCDWELWDCDNINSDQEPLQLKFETEKLALNEVVLSLLDLGYVGQAWRLATMFKYYSFELEAVLTCLKLVREILQPSQIDPKVSELLSPNSLSAKQQGTENALTTLEIIEKIEKSIPHGKVACQRIKIHLQVSQILWSSYSQIAAEKESIKLFLNVLSCPNPGKYNLAKELCQIRKIPDCDVISALYDKITNFVKKSVIVTGANVTDFPLKSSNEENLAFSQQLRLCKDPSLLGYKLLRDITNVEDYEETDYRKCHIYQVGICVICHTCFTSCCSMEGISKVLQKARLLTMELRETQKFSLMLSLLTGIGRYGEMTYIFDILRENEQFDVLLKKNTEELPLLRLALLDYLKRHHGVSDREAYSMLAVKFKMFREIAEMLETSAKERLKKLELSDLSKPNFKSTLQAILQDLEASTKKYVEDGCLHHAQNCLHLAQLVALQIHLSSNNIWILGLDEPTVHQFLVEHKQFSHSFIVALAYQHQQSWNEALYRNLIERGDWEYFRDFKANLGISEAVIGGVAKRYSLSRSKGANEKHMKRLLNLCDNVVARYQIANQLGFIDITTDLLKGDAGDYLKDIISQKKIHYDLI